jgi:hypothetical protein
MLTIAFTRIKRLSKPQDLPAVDQAAAAEWFSGWWHGLAVGATSGIAVCVIFFKHFLGA